MGTTARGYPSPALVLLPSRVAHAFGARYDLPLPLWIFVVGAGAVVFGSFLFVVRTETVPSAVVDAGDGAAAGPAPGPVTGLISLVVLVGLIYCGVEGSQAIPENILPTSFWLLAWIAVPVSCGLLGDWTTRVNPFGALARLVDRPAVRARLFPGPPVTWPAAVGWWPAAALFFFVAGGELIYNLQATRPFVTACGLAVYALVTVFGSLVFGASTWLRYGELFSVLFATWGRLGFARYGRPGGRGWLGGLEETISARRSRITFVVLMLGSVTFDGLLATPLWKNTLNRLPLSLEPGTGRYIALAIVAFAVLIGLIWAFFAGSAWAVRRAGQLPSSTVSTLAALLPSLLPIAFAYLVAHNLDYLFVNGQLLIPLAGNPTGRHQWLPAPFNDSYEINKHILPPALIWYLATGLIVVAHIAAVVIAHRHLGRAASTTRSSRRAERPWIVAMVLYTMTSLWLLAQPIAKESAAPPKAAARAPVSARYGDGRGPAAAVPRPGEGTRRPRSGPGSAADSGLP